MDRFRLATLITLIAGAALWASARIAPTAEAAGQTPAPAAPPRPAQDPAKFLTQPLMTNIFTADPAAHVFGGKIFIYPSHDYDSGVASDGNGSQFAMRDYHVFSMDRIPGPVVDHGVALDIKDVPWAGRQMWAPDAAEKNGTYYLYFPVKDKQDAFRIGVATSRRPEGPFKALPQPIAGTYSIDPAVFTDTDGKAYIYFGGIWGGQLQRWATGAYKAEDTYPANTEPALTSKMARMADNMTTLAEPVKNVVIQDEDGKPLTAGDNARRFFEGSWMHKYNGTYYYSYSTGDTHFIAYATSKTPYGPFTYRGKILEPVLGWTNHHSIVEFQGKWWLFYHDSQTSGGQTHLRNIKVTELKYRADGTIETIDAYRE
jgi:hypothetical protein